MRKNRSGTLKTEGVVVEVSSYAGVLDPGSEVGGEGAALPTMSGAVASRGLGVRASVELADVDVADSSESEAEDVDLGAGCSRSLQTRRRPRKGMSRKTFMAASHAAWLV